MQNKYIILKSPVKIGDYERVASYSGSLTKGEEQLLVTRDLKFFLTDGKGGYLEFKSINSGITVDEVTQKLNDLDNKLSDEISDLDTKTSGDTKTLKDAVDALSLKFSGYVTTTDFNSLKAQVESNTTLAVHDNRKVIDKFSEGTDGLPLYGGAAVYTGYTLYKAAIVETDEELEDTKGKIVDFSDVFNTWYRFSHDTSNNQPANKSETQSWNYSNGTINSTVNSTTYIGFVSKDIYDIYTHEVTLKSSDSDNDRIGVIIAFAKDNNGIEHTLSAMRDMETGTNWFLVYDYCKSTQQILSYKQSIAGDVRTGWNAIPNGSRIRIKRNKNLIEAYASPFNSTKIDESSKLTLDLNSDSKFNIFKNPCAYGYSCYSQNKSMFTDVLFYESNAFLGNDNNIIDIRTGDVWIKNNGKWAIDTTKDISSVIGIDKVVFNEYTNKIFYIKDNNTIIPLFKEEIDVNEFKEVKNLAIHNNRDVLDKFSVDENDTPLFDGKKIVADFDTSAIEAEIADLQTRSTVGSKLKTGLFRVTSNIPAASIKVNTIIPIATKISGDFALNADNTITLPRGSIYRVTSKLRYSTTSLGGYITYCIHDFTNGTGKGVNATVNSGDNWDGQQEAIAYIDTTAQDINIGVYALSVISPNEITAGFSFLDIQEVARTTIIDPAEDAKKIQFEHGLFTNVNDQTIVPGTKLKMSNMLYGNMSLSTNEYVKLKSGKTYKIRGMVGDDKTYLDCMVYDVTNSKLLGLCASNSSQYVTQPMAITEYTPTVDCEITLYTRYFDSANTGTVVGWRSWLEVEEIAQPYYFNYYKDSISSAVLFEGSANTIGIYSLTDDITKYEKLIVYASCNNSAGESKIVMKSETIDVKDIIYNIGDKYAIGHIPTSVSGIWYYSILYGFTDSTHFRVGGAYTDGSNIISCQIHKIEGIGYNYDNPYQDVITTVDEFTLTDTEIDSDIMSIWNGVGL